MLALKQQVEAVLQPLLGEPLTDMWRYAGFQRFEFGPQQRSRGASREAAPQGDRALIAGCEWRITGPEGAIVSSADFTSAGRNDERAYPFYDRLGTDPPVVTALDVDETGGIRLELSGGYLLEIQPEGEAAESDAEQWLFYPRDGRRVRTILYPDGLERSRRGE